MESTITDTPIKDNDTLVRQPDFVLEKVDNDYQLRHRGKDTAVYINETAALLWELCDGRRSVGDIKKMLAAAYPDSAAEISAGIDESLSMLLHHEALARHVK